MKNLLTPFLIFSLLISCKPEIKQKETAVAEEIVELSSNNEINENIYSNELLNLSFSYPKNWEVQSDTINKVVYIMSNSSSDDGFKEMINIMVGDSKGLSLDDFFSLNMTVIDETFDELSISDGPGETEINGREFKKVKYNYIVQGYPLTNHIFVTNRDSSVYIVSCSALQNTFDQYQDQFMSIVNSIEIR